MDAIDRREFFDFRRPVFGRLGLLDHHFKLRGNAAATPSAQRCGDCLQLLDVRWYCVEHDEPAKIGHLATCPRYVHHDAGCLIPLGQIPAKKFDF